MGGCFKKLLKDNVAVIELDYEGGNRLNFDSVQVDMEYTNEEGTPFIWRKVRVVFLRGQYVLQVFSDGVKFNRRASFRVSVATMARLRVMGKGPSHIMVRDVSLTGFSITDRDKELSLELGNKLSVGFEDLGYALELIGEVVRIEEHEDMTIYGLRTTNLCKDLSMYISVKQRRNKNH